MLTLKNIEIYEYREGDVPTEEALKLVLSSNGEGVYASADVLFKGAVFGRDSLKVGRDLLNVKPELVEEIILTLASFQGVKESDINEEQTGKIMHEMRRNQNLDDVSKLIFDELTGRWGKEWSESYECEQMVYFGSVDATPAYVQLLCEYCENYGTDILNKTVTKRDGQEVTIGQTMIDAVGWTVQKLDSSPSGLLDYKRVNPNGIENQVWKDSKEFYVHADGSFVNHEASVASIEVQGIVYDALVKAAEYMSNESIELQARAIELRDRTLELLWNADERYFAVGVDQASDGSIRTIDTRAANPACLLASKFFDSLPDEDKQLFVSSIVEAITGDDFLTAAGIRSRSLRDANLLPFWDYHGTFVTWPKESYDIILGLRMQGFPAVAEQIENRLLNAVRKSNGFPEFIYVDQSGRVLASQPHEQTHGDFLIIDSTNKPEHIQAWTVSSVMAVMANRLHGSVEVPVQQDWQRNLESDLLSRIPNIPYYESRDELDEQYPDYAYKLVKEESLKSSNFLHDKIGNSVA